MKQIKRYKNSDENGISIFPLVIGAGMLIALIAPRTEKTLGSPELVNQYSLNYEQSQTSSKVTEYINIEEPSEEIVEEEEESTIIEDENIEEEVAADEVEVFQPIGTKYELPYYANYNGFKSYMSYTAICLKGSNELYLQQNYAYTDDYGIREVEGRYCVAMGTYFGLTVGQYFDLVLANGTVIPCIMSDTKSDKHTDKNNIYTVHSNCCSEFIVDMNYLSRNVKNRGDISYAFEEWNSPVVEVIVYEENILAK